MLKRLSISLLLVLSSSMAFADSFISDAKETAFLKKFNKNHPDLTVTKATYLPSVSLYQIYVTASDLPFYTNEKMQFLMVNAADVLTASKSEPTPASSDDGYTLSSSIELPGF